MLVATGSMAKVIGSASPAFARGRGFAGYGPLSARSDGLLVLPAGFRYRVFSSEGDTLSRGGLVPASHDGMAAFSAGLLRHVARPQPRGRASKTWTRTALVPVAHVPGATYDPEAVGGTTTLLVGHDRRLLAPSRQPGGHARPTAPAARRRGAPG